MRESARVLVVDDDSEIVRALTLRLGAAGYEVHHAPNGREGLRMALSCEPAVIVLDIHMPVMNGLEMLSRLRGHSAIGHVPVIMLSASIIEEKQALDLGARYFLQKPYDPKGLITALRAVLNDAPESMAGAPASPSLATDTQGAPS